MLRYQAFVAGVARIDDLDPALVDLRGVPVGASLDDGRVEPGADLAGAAHDEQVRLDDQVVPALMLVSARCDRLPVDRDPGELAEDLLGEPFPVVLGHSCLCVTA